MAAVLLSIALWGALGLAVWPLAEYVIHGGLGHRWPGPVAPLHWMHHERPERVFTAPVAWVPIATLLYVVAVLVLGWVPGSSLVAGLVAGFLRYEWIHYRIHFREPRSERERELRAHHLAHHFCDPGAYFGVSTRLWDRVFGTLGRDWRRDYASVIDLSPQSGPSNFGELWPARPGRRSPEVR